MENVTLPVCATIAGMGVSAPDTTPQVWARFVGRSPGESGRTYAFCALSQCFAGKQSKRIPLVRRIFIHGKIGLRFSYAGFI